MGRKGRKGSKKKKKRKARIMQAQERARIYRRHAKTGIHGEAKVAQGVRRNPNQAIMA